MRTGTVCLLLVVAALVCPTAFAQGKAAPPAESLKISADGSIEHVGGDKDGVIIRYWQVNHDQPPNLVKEIKPFLGKDVIMTPRGQNMIRIEAPRSKWEVIEKLLDVIDVPEPQVYVEAKIIEIKYDSNLEYGFEPNYDRSKAGAGWPFFQAFTGNFNPESYLNAIATSSPFIGGTFGFQTTDPDWVAKHGEVTYILRALQERGSAEILSQPAILAMQGQKASITTGLKFPIQSVDVRGNQTFVTTKFEQTGIKLDITPKLVGRSYVTLSIKAEDSQITDEVPGPGGTINPVISERSATTEVNVRDGETIIIGGLLSRSKLEAKSGLPFISDIPIIGYAFSSTNWQEVKAELVFFITPKIIKRHEQSVILPPGERKRLSK
jgi:type II secretory pathway component GspD/PulD (secretin)